MFVLVYLGSTIKVDRESEITIADGKVQVSHLRQWRTDKAVSEPPAVSSLGLTSESQEEREVMEARGAHFLSAMSEGKAGRKVDPNSALQRVWATIREILNGQEEMRKELVIARVASAHPDIKETTINAYCMSCKDINRNWGLWSLKSE